MRIKRKQEKESLSAAQASELIRQGRAPAGLVVRGHLDLSGAEDLAELPEGLQANSIDLSGCRSLRSLPWGLRARFELDLTNCVG